MKKTSRNILIYILALYFTELLVDGVIIEGGFISYALAGASLYVLFLVLKPILSVISIPLNILSLGLFSFFTNSIILYLMTVFVPQVKITSFTFPGYEFLGFVIPEFYLNPLFSYIATAAVISILVNFILWLIKN